MQLAIPPLTEDLRRVLIDADTIRSRVDELAAEINRDYKDITEPLVIVGVLKGSVFFLTDLARKLRLPHIIYYTANSC